MNLREMIKESNITVAVSLGDLKEFALEIIQQTKRELEEAIFAEKSETYISRQRACEILDVDATTLWRWAKRSYLIPVTVGGKNRYKMSDINKLLN